MKKKFSILFVIILCVITILFFVPYKNNLYISAVHSPIEFVISNSVFKLDNLDCFDSAYTEHNKNLAQKLNITEQEAFVFGNLGKNWAYNLMNGRYVFPLKHEDLIYLKYSYRNKFLYSGFCIQNDKPFYPEKFTKIIEHIRSTKYLVLDLTEDKIYETNNPKVKTLKNYIVLKKIHLPRHLYQDTDKTKHEQDKFVTIKDVGKIKILFTDLSTKLVPSHKCETNICKEILTNIKHSKNTIDMAIYGYSSVPEIEHALTDAAKRGVKIRMVYDLNQKGENIYSDTKIITNLVPNNKSDYQSGEAGNIMHNKFYIFDNETLITGSANLSHTDMSGFNSNNIIVINSSEIAKIYKQEFEQMFSGNFHNQKTVIPKNKIKLKNSELEIYFSPKDKGIQKAILPLINNAHKYIYIPTFMITDKSISEALIKAQKRGIDVKIIVDALNASAWHSKHNLLRLGGISVKTENYAGKMHSKSIIIDDLYTIIGSMNFSNSGENKNDENFILIKDSDIAKTYKNFFLYQWNKIDNKWLKYNARAEGKDSIGSCFDGIDNNYDGLIDSDDPACKKN